jgi:hypothetical protein
LDLHHGNVTSTFQQIDGGNGGLSYEKSDNDIRRQRIQHTSSVSTVYTLDRNSAILPLLSSTIARPIVFYVGKISWRIWNTSSSTAPSLDKYGTS